MAYPLGDWLALSYDRYVREGEINSLAAGAAIVARGPETETETETETEEATKEEEMVIAVMGMTGSGKSTFIQMMTGNQNIYVGHTLQSGILIHSGPQKTACHSLVVIQLHQMYVPFNSLIESPSLFSLIAVTARVPAAGLRFLHKSLYTTDI
jgi:ABC-type transport system involved in cytochrome bd biosynthesis fused ATPase/permease subunit